MAVTVTVHRYTMDRYGDRTQQLTFHIGQCAFAPRTGTESDDRSTTVTAEADLYVPPWSGIRPQDVVELPDGSTWEVRGAAQQWESPYPSHWTPGDVVALTRTRG